MSISDLRTREREKTIKWLKEKIKKKTGKERNYKENNVKRSQDYHSKGISNSDSITSYLANLCFFLCFLTVLRNFQPSPPPTYVKPLCILNTQ